MALLSTGLLTFGAPAFAEQVESVAAAETNESTAEDEEENQVVLITGIRGSLARAQALKMDNTSIIEAISAEDIGKLPDTSIAESLARLPGVTGERRNGRTSGLSIRGLNENYIATSLNGRELLGMGDNRGVEYDLYPTEIVTEIVVCKTPDAAVLNQGIGGTVDLRTVNPLSAESTFTANATYERNQEDSLNPDFDNDGARLSFNFVDQFANDTIGVALVLATQESTRQELNQRVWGYPGSGVEPGNNVYGGHDTFVRSALLDRSTVAAVFEFAPNDKFKAQIDALYIDFEESDVRRGIEEAGPEWGGGNYTASTTENGLVTSGFYDGFQSVIRNDSRKQDSKLTTLGLNLEYQVTDTMILDFDYSTGKVDKTITDVESYSGVGRAGIDGRPATARSWTQTGNGVFFGDHPNGTIDLSDPNLIRLAGPQAWGGSLAPVAAFQGNPDFAPNTAQDGFVNQPDFDEELDNFRLELDGDFEYSIFESFNVGIAYSDRTKTKINEGAYLTAPTWPGDGPIPADSIVGETDLSFFGLGNIIAYDGLGLFNSGFYTETAASGLETGRLGDTYTINEELLTIYGRLNIDSQIGDVLVRGNVGVQYVSTDQKSSGFSTVTGADLFVNATVVSGGDDYTDILPSLNLSFEISENQFIRFAASKIQSRPRMDDMRPNTTVGFAFNDDTILNPDLTPWSGSSGNSSLQPLQANQYDLSYENYFADDGFFAASFFYKDLTNWHSSGAVLADFSEFYIPGYHQATTGEPPLTFDGIITFTEDGLKGFIRGQEYQASVPLRLIDDSLDGLGMVFSATFLDGKFDGGSPVPGLSDESYAVTAYYEKGGFEFRVSGTKRNKFQTETRGISLSLVAAGDLGAELWDAQISYDFNESDIEWLHGLRVTLQGQNLTDEKTIQANNDPREITSYQSFGANYLLGLNYDF